MIDNRFSPTPRQWWLVTKYRKRSPIRIIALRLLKSLVDVLQQYSLPNTDLRMAILDNRFAAKAQRYLLFSLSWRPRLISAPAFW
jgi:hypothetical protein